MQPDEPTDRQREVLELFVIAARSGRSSPTIREIGDAVDISSTNGITDKLKALVRKGWLELGAKGTARSRTLTDKARRLYGLPVPRRAA